MLTEADRHRAAEEILRAERERRAIPQLSKTFPKMEIEDAYRVQELWAEDRIAKGARITGHKIGLTSRAMQMASKITEPDYGRILDDALFNDGARIRADQFLKPRLEVELAFVMGSDLEGPNCRLYDVMRAWFLHWRLSTTARRRHARSSTRSQITRPSAPWSLEVA
jgi:2-oxo-hept-3-ene-1,7-dioate hydratase